MANINNQIDTSLDSVAEELFGNPIQKNSKTKVQSESLRTPTESLRTPTESLRTPTESLRTPNEFSRTPTESLRTPNEFSRTPTESVKIPIDQSKRTSVKRVGTNSDTNTNLPIPSSVSSEGHSEKDSETSEQVDNVDFSELSYEDVQVNLRVLADLKEGEKLMIGFNKFLMVDQRIGQSVRRWLSSDSRMRTIDFIEHVINEANRICKSIVCSIEGGFGIKENMEKLNRFQQLLTQSLIGLGRHTTTYSDDKLSRARIETIQDKVRTFCDLDLKKAIDGNKSH
jgi:hypothetical protein